MDYSFFQQPPPIVSCIIFLMILFFNWLGYWLKKKQFQKNPLEVPGKLGSVEGTMLSIMALLLGFTFSVAVTKFETRRMLVVEEANTIVTAVLRCDLYPDSIRNLIRADFKDYVETRVDYYLARNDEDKIIRELEKSRSITARIWNRIMFVSSNPEMRLRSQQMIPVINNVMEIVTKRDASRTAKVPRLVLWTLLILVLTSALLLGNDYNGTKKSKLLTVGYAILMTLTLNLIIELNNPRQGFITLDAEEKKITELRDLF